MILGYKKFIEYLNNDQLYATKSMFTKTIKSFHFQLILKNDDFDQQIFQKIDESKVIVIDTYFNANNKYIIICFERQLIIIDPINQKIIKAIFSRKNEDKIFFVNKYINNDFKEELNNFNINIKLITKNVNKTAIEFWQKIQQCFYAYLIRKSYCEMSKNRIYDFIECDGKKNELDKIQKNEDLIFLRFIDRTQTSKIELFFHIKTEKIIAVKTFFEEEEEKEKLIIREINNYNFLNYPLVPKFYGQIQNKYAFAFEFINGETLDKIKMSSISVKQKLIIIIEILYIIRYLHRNNYIYRDLKPNNLILDSNNHVVLIDFDRMINSEKEQYESKQTFTNDLGSEYMDPECFKGNNPTFQSDIYSIRKMIIYILNIKNEFILPSLKKFKANYPKLYDIFCQFFYEKTNRNSTIDLLSDLIDFFFHIF